MSVPQELKGRAVWWLGGWGGVRSGRGSQRRLPGTSGAGLSLESSRSCMGEGKETCLVCLWQLASRGSDRQEPSMGAGTILPKEPL